MSDNPFDGVPVDDDSQPPTGSEEGSAAAKFIQVIDDRTNEAEYYWALDTLLGIRDSIVKYKRVTPGQREAVSRIDAAVERKRDQQAISERRRYGSRRYEGFSR